MPPIKKTTKAGDKVLGLKGKAPNYKFDWEYVCAFTKWTPTNQFLNAKRTYVAAEMTLERFGFIGTDKKCFWGMTGVFWLKPLKVDQILPVKKVVKKTKPAKKAKKTTPGAPAGPAS